MAKAKKISKVTGKLNPGTRRRRSRYPLPDPSWPLRPNVALDRWFYDFKLPKNGTTERRRVYFGRLTEPEEALATFNAEKDQWLAGVNPRQDAITTTGSIGDLRDHFLEAKGRKLASGKLAPSSFASYQTMTRLAVDHLGRQRRAEALKPADFASLQGAIEREYTSPSNRLKAAIITRMIFSWSVKNGHLDRLPAYGSEFTGADRTEIREARHAKGRRTFTAAEIRKLLDKADVHLKAAIFLGICGGYTQKEVASLTFTEVDLEAALIDHLRAKTAVARRVPLWPEVVEAIKASIAKRPKPRKPGTDDLVFITRYGAAWHEEFLTGEEGNQKLSRTDSFGLTFRRLMKDAKMKAPGLGFGHLRHTHRSISDAACDANASAMLMGHELAGGAVAANYIDGVSIERLKRVSEVVRAWLFSKQEGATKAG